MFPYVYTFVKRFKRIESVPNVPSTQKRMRMIRAKKEPKQL